MGDASTADRQAGRTDCKVSLLGAFELCVHGVRVDLPPAAARLVAYLALQVTPVSRDRAAAVLWPDAADRKSGGCLRSALWRVRTSSPHLVEHQVSCLRLNPSTIIDTAALALQVRRLIDPGVQCGVTDLDPGILALELLPGWDDEWALFERERLRQLSLGGLEALSRRHLKDGRPLAALEAASRAISLDPLRESAHRALIDAHLAEGNVCAAVRDLRSLERILAREMDLAPSTELVDRVFSAMAGRREVADGRTGWSAPLELPGARRGVR
ncbi:DNA-binding SARP family transcriptional activator [Humibacillus xanthopallidus]|uniref:DNA-binding SARP family transcriptional activator n=1 Tax=Humibacillus xanthopallidus TaxID=412689 RepID=A0A543PWX0_9MICO|nr:BTAD domain-containing putative transcriptional regulator [Humibacillus xanthopallidus]TQN48574.1 DNA-binding SARP family transcriptional activator [Humibacillus xanthopallidus]